MTREQREVALPRGEFCGIVGAIVARFLRQNELPPVGPDAIAGISARLWRLAMERGLPPPLADDECGAPGGMSEAETEPLVTQALGDGPPPLAAAVRQLVKACFYPEFKVCQDSYRELAKDGACRRQELARVRGRVSGTHCVDCPHWVALTPTEHAVFLERAWVERGPAGFALQRDIFLPEDFRALRILLHTAARKNWSRSGERA